MNAKAIDLEYSDDEKKRIATIVGINTCQVARKYGAFSDYRNMTYDVRVHINGEDRDFSFDTMIYAEGFAVLAAFCKDVTQLMTVFGTNKDVVQGYCIDLNASYFFDMIGGKIDF